MAADQHPLTHLAVCHECDTLQHLSHLRPGQNATCVKCAALLARYPKGGLATPFAFFIASAVFFMIANLLPFIALDLGGLQQQTNLIGTSLRLLEDGMPGLSFIVLLTTILAPGMVIFGHLYVLTAIHFNYTFAHLKGVLHLMTHIQHWGMLDVFLLGVLVSLVKLSDLATVVLGPAFYAFVILMLLSTMAVAKLEPRLLWNHLHS